jgi:hypothetical protein
MLPAHRWDICAKKMPAGGAENTTGGQVAGEELQSLASQRQASLRPDLCSVTPCRGLGQRRIRATRSVVIKAEANQFRRGHDIAGFGAAQK